MKEAKIKILILNYNGEDFLKNCLESVSSINYSNYSIVLIDNNSTDNSVKYIKSNYPEVEIVETGKNLMYSGGYNYFFENNNDDCFYMVLNNDTMVESNILFHFMQGVERYGEENIYGSKIMFMHQKDKIWYGGGKVNLKKGIIRHLNIRDIDSSSLKDSETDYISGCCLFAHSNIIRKLGGFDISFSMYMEDVDFCLRANDMNIKCYFLSSPKVFHYVSGSVNWKFIKIVISYAKLSFKHTGFSSFFNVPLFILRRFLSI